jgi:ADP-ribose pyrophosphatase YjhB (NUDIX family)
MQHPVLATSANDIPDFSSKGASCIFYVETDKRLLTIPQKQWSLPGGRLDPNEDIQTTALRILQEQTGETPHISGFAETGTWYARLGGADSTIHFYRLVLPAKPATLASARWISIYAYSILHKIEETDRPADGRLEGFEAIYGSRLWKRVSESSSPSLTLGKGERQLRFDSTNRLILTFLGTSYSGKTTQAELAEETLGLKSISVGDIYEGSKQDNVPLNNMIRAYFDQHRGEPHPCELNLGMVARRLAEADCQGTDLVIPFHLDVPDGEVDDRIEDDSGVQQRRTDFQQGKDHVMGALQRAVSLQTLTLRGTDPIEEVYHRISEHIQQQLDSRNASQQQAPLHPVANNTSNAVAKSRKIPEWGLLTIGLVAGAAAVLAVTLIRKRD